MKRTLLIKNGRLIDPAKQIDRVTDLYIADGHILATEEPPGFEPEQTIDAKNHWVIPGIIDLSARLREPGLEYKANITSESIAAAASGITTLCVPPDTDPVIDEPAVVELIHRQADNAGHSNVLTLGALTAGLKGVHLSEMASLKTAGCVGLSNAKKPVQSSLILRRAFEYAATHDITIFIEANDISLANKGCAHEGPIATRLGLPAIPVSAETAAIAQQLELIEESGVSAHFCRLSSARSVELIELAKARGLKVSADVAAHQLHLTEMDISSFNSHCHVFPPLRSERDRNALRAGLFSSSINAICSDHQPHQSDAKLAPFPATEPGISALETLLPLTLKLVDMDIIPLERAIASLTSEPAAILGIDAGTLAAGTNADICIINPEQEWQLDSDTMLSHGRNTPFDGWSFKGKVSHTIINGDVIMMP